MAINIHLKSWLVFAGCFICLKKWITEKKDVERKSFSRIKTRSIDMHRSINFEFYMSVVQQDVKNRHKYMSMVFWPRRLQSVCLYMSKTVIKIILKIVYCLTLFTAYAYNARQLSVETIVWMLLTFHNCMLIEIHLYISLIEFSFLNHLL